MKVRFSVTFDCEFDIDPLNEDWQEPDDNDQNLHFDEDFALERLHDLVTDEPERYATDYAIGVSLSDFTIAKGLRP